MDSKTNLYISIAMMKSLKTDINLVWVGYSYPFFSSRVKQIFLFLLALLEPQNIFSLSWLSRRKTESIPRFLKIIYLKSCYSTQNSWKMTHCNVEFCETISWRREEISFRGHLAKNRGDWNGTNSSASIL